MKKAFPAMRAIVVSKELLADIEGAVSYRLGSSDFNVEYICKAKGIPDRHYQSLKELENCDNSLERSVESLTMKASSGDDFDLRIVFGKALLEDLCEDFNGIDFSTPVNVHGHICGTQEWIDDLRTDVTYQIRKHSRGDWYSFLSHAGVLFTAILTVIFARILFHNFGLPQTYSIPSMGIVNQPFDTTTFWGNFLPYAQLSLCALTLAMILRGPVKRLFPRIKFILGDNQGTEQRRKELIVRIAWDVVIVILVDLFILFLQTTVFG